MRQWDSRNGATAVDGVRGAKKCLGRDKRGVWSPARSACGSFLPVVLKGGSGTRAASSAIYGGLIGEYLDPPSCILGQTPRALQWCEFSDIATGALLLLLIEEDCNGHLPITATASCHEVLLLRLAASVRQSPADEVSSASFSLVSFHSPAARLVSGVYLTFRARSSDT